MSLALCCTKCGQTKPETEFSADARTTTGFNRNCKQCVRDRSRSWYERIGQSRQDIGELTLTCKHCEKQFTYVKSTGPRRMYCSQRCKMQGGVAQREVRRVHATRRCACGSDDVARVGKPVCPDCRKDKRDPERERSANRRRRLALYGLTEAEFEDMVTLQRGCCAVCSTDDPGARGWQIDHDHACCPGIGSCGQCVRGLLCHDCNLLLGHAKDRIDVLEQASKYLISNSQFKLKLHVVTSDA